MRVVVCKSVLCVCVNFGLRCLCVRWRGVVELSCVWSVEVRERCVWIRAAKSSFGNFQNEVFGTSSLWSWGSECDARCGVLCVERSGVMCVCDGFA